MNKRLIALMIAATITTTLLTGCGESKSLDHIKAEETIRQTLEYDANTNLSKKNVQSYGLGLDYSIVDERFYITFKTYAYQSYGRISHIEEDAKIKYEVEKDFYYDFKNNYSLIETTEDVERVKELVEKYDPVEVINPSMNYIFKKSQDN